MRRNPPHTVALICSLIALPLATHSAPEESDLASAYARYKDAIAQQDYETALVYARKVDRAAARELGADDPKTGVLAYNLGAVHYQLERYRDAIEPLERAAGIYHMKYGPDAPENLVPIRKLGLAYQALEDWPRAEQTYLQAVSIIEADQGREAEPIADLLIQLIEVAEQQKKFSRARNYGRRALYILDRAGKTRGVRSGRVHVDLVTAEMQLGDATGANKHMGRAIEIYEENFAVQAPELKAVYLIAAKVYAQTGKDPAARKYRRRAQGSAD